MRTTRLWLLLGGIVASSVQAAPVDRSRIPPIHLDEGLLLRPCDSLDQGVKLGTFRTDAACVEAMVRLVHVSSPHRLRFLYYDPAGNQYAATPAEWTFQPAAGGSGYHQYARIAHRLPVAGQEAAWRVGEWKVAVWLDNAHLAETSFELQRPVLPLEQNLGEGRELYRAGQYQAAMERLNIVANSARHMGLLAEAGWWLALSAHALGQQAAVEETLLKVLQADASFAASPGSLEQSKGGAEVHAQLEQLRRERFPELFVRQVAPPQVELTPAEEAPVLARRWPLWKKMLIYGGIPAVAAATTFVLIGGGDTTVQGPPTVVLTVAATAQRDPDYGLLCVGAMPLTVSISGGTPPYEAIVTVAKSAQSLQTVRVDGVVASLTSSDTVVLRRSFEAPGTFSIATPPIDIVTSIIGVAELRFTVVVKDAGSSVSFEAALPGAPLPSVVLDAIRSDERVLQQPTSGVVVTGCRQ